MKNAEEIRETYRELNDKLIRGTYGDLDRVDIAPADKSDPGSVLAIVCCWLLVA
jgi:hypothetical protein